MSKVLFISHSRGLHGAEVVLLRCIAAAQSSGHTCWVLLPGQVADGGLDKEVASLVGDSHVWHLNYRAYGYGALRTMLVGGYNLPAILRLCHRVKSEGIDVIYSNTSILWLGAIVAKMVGVRHVWHIHEPVSELFGFVSSLASIYRRWMTGSNTACVFISRRQQLEWEEALGCRIAGKIVYNPVKESDVKKRQEHDGVVYGYLGAFDVRKNIAALVQSFGKVQREKPNSRLILCGAISPEEQQMYHGEGIEVRPHTSDVAGFFSEVDVLVLPSWSETMPLVVLEAIAHGVSTIQTTESGMGELLTQGDDTLFVKPGDGEALYESMRLLQDAACRIKMVEHGRQTLSRHQFNEQFDTAIQSIVVCE